MFVSFSLFAGDILLIVVIVTDLALLSVRLEDAGMDTWAFDGWYV